ncbi:hypothetical protein GCM10019059_35730 [Camelimonas fluminis]|uniref:Uncharacterized protein n=1 Tax=Camelimonas fluminis TaxID=1576911 RepID=A0ABV7UFN3_9HYPH|nr:hypothetical protein [Camelimonas fluminis]GHE72983.1 hypothetical protein GCM10019059_35730 [Camelimonas fluminis]
MTAQSARTRHFAIRAAIAKKNAAAAARGKTPAPSQPLARKVTTASTSNMAPSRAPATVAPGTVSDLKRIQGATGPYYRGKFQAKGSDEIMTVFIAEHVHGKIQPALTRGYARYYGVKSNGAFRILGTARINRAPKAALQNGPEVDYSYQFGAYFPSLA